MRSLRVVVAPPSFDQDLRLPQAIEDFAIQKLVSEPGVEAFTISVFPWAARFDICGLCADGLDPVLYGLSNELWAVVGTYERRYSAQDEQVAQNIDDVA